MKSVVIDSPGKVRVGEFPDPVAGGGEVVVDLRACGFCGTDLHIFRGEYDGTYPARPGHEASGVVSEVGEGVTDFRVGDRVAIEPNILCGDCPACESGRGNFCENWTAIGVTLPGCMAERVVAPERQLFKIGELDFETAAFMEPLSCVLHGMAKLGSLDGEDVLVMGAGPIGLLIMQVAKLRAARTVTVCDLRETRLKLAESLGADRAEVVDTPGLTESAFGVVIDASGNPDAIRRTVELAHPGGRILWFGVAPEGTTIPVEPFRVFRKGLSIHSAFTSLGNSTEAIELLSSGKVQTAPLVSHRFGLDGFAEAARLLESDPDVLKVLIIPAG